MLEVKDLCAGYGSMPVLRDVSIHAPAGEILLIVGENGAGKSTLLRTIAGFIIPSRGSILLQGREVGGRAPEDLVARGLRLVLDGHRVFPELSTLDNLRIAAVRSPAGFGPRGREIDEVLALFPVLETKLRSLARELSGGQQQMLALGQALLARPAVLLCDEPSTGLAQALLPPILQVLRRLAAEGSAVVVVEQHLELALPLADQVVVIQRGEVISAASAAEFAASRTREQVA